MNSLQWTLVFLLAWLAGVQLAGLAGLDAETLGSLATAFATLVLVGVTANYVRLTRALLLEERARSGEVRTGNAAELGTRLLLVTFRGMKLLDECRNSSDTPVSRAFEELAEMKTNLARFGMTVPGTADAAVRLAGVLDRIAVWLLSDQEMPADVHAWLRYDLVSGVGEAQKAAWEILNQPALAAEFLPPVEPTVPRPQSVLPANVR
jgi:hypothetical protein